MYKQNKVNKETFRMQMLAGIITEAEYKEKLNENPESPMYELINEDLALVGDIALGVAGGLAGLWALFKGIPAVLGTLGNAAGAIAGRMEKKAKEAAVIARKDGRLETIKPIIAKFENDANLKDMYQALPEYSRSITAKSQAQNAERAKQMQAIAKYIKSKLTPDEMQYFIDISSMLRTGDIKL